MLGTCETLLMPCETALSISDESPAGEAAAANVPASLVASDSLPFSCDASNCGLLEFD